jgi:hypothetical protein
LSVVSVNGVLPCKNFASSIPPQIIPTHQDIFRGKVLDPFLLTCGQWSHNPRWRTKHQGTGWNSRSFCKQRAGSDNGAGAHLRPIHDNRVHPDQDAVLDRAGVKDRPVPATDLISYRQTISVRDMQDRSILDIRFCAYLNLIDVCSYHALKPDAGSRTDGDITEDGGVRRNEHIVRKNGMCAQESIEALENLVKIHKNKINALTKSSEYCENDKISSVRARPGLDIGSQAHDLTANASLS